LFFAGEKRHGRWGWEDASWSIGRVGVVGWVDLRGDIVRWRGGGGWERGRVNRHLVLQSIFQTFLEHLDDSIPLVRLPLFQSVAHCLLTGTPRSKKEHGRSGMFSPDKKYSRAKYRTSRNMTAFTELAIIWPSKYWEHLDDTHL